ncbi:3-oxoacyl-[acyl-carrier-protein] synthase 2 [Vulcanimicrobium alpinum]|uniref:3-oxoacyl-[acyl-carrier-protein] synthase 2 n=1 Tax=Vulcanimicrobium alpinum TaxID=3016050 RepID=A0AAN1XY25_UNVUL|nr:beta-ketoacyl-[acyl-carrier-protein] synthase family protein [Vulcanimicrobium alpinum]BDE07030.1 3-oxoacyl-[acyl-carrier-protein] synthase 2 [Vulcanimicrobium alpinum]
MTAHRVAVTGIGVVTPLGIGIDAFWEGVLSERVAVAPITRFDTAGYRTRIAAQIDAFEPRAFLTAKRLNWTDRFSQFSIAAARLALEDAGYNASAASGDVGVYLGSALGGLAFADEQHDVFRERGLDAVKPLLAISVFGGAATCNVAIEFGLRGPTVANGNSCASGAVAIGDAFRAITRGDVRAALAGGVEAPLSPLVFGAFTVIRAMSERNDAPQAASRPFDRGRDGFVMAEGAGVLLLERLADARARGARVYGEIAGYGLTNDAYHMSAPRPDGAMNADAMRRALDEAHAAPADVDLVNAHGSGTPLGDRCETVALETLFGERAASVPVTATKGQHGHALGATGAWEAALSLLALVHQTVPRSVNTDDADPACNLALTRTRLERRLRTVLSNSAGFGGINAALVFRRLDDDG